MGVFMVALPLTVASPSPPIYNPLRDLTVAELQALLAAAVSACRARAMAEDERRAKERADAWARKYVTWERNHA
jgi:hypothetical protein